MVAVKGVPGRGERSFVRGGVAIESEKKRRPGVGVDENVEAAGSVDDGG